LLSGLFDPTSIDAKQRVQWAESHQTREQKDAGDGQGDGAQRPRNGFGQV